MKFFKYLILGLLAASVASLSAQDQPKQTEKPAAPAKGEKSADAAPKKKKTDGAQVNGKIESVDKSAMTVTIEGKKKKSTVHLTSKTKITKAGQPGTIADIKAGEEIAAQVTKNKAGDEEAVTLRVGPKPAKKNAEKPAKKAADQPEKKPEAAKK